MSARKAVESRGNPLSCAAEVSCWVRVKEIPYRPRAIGEGLPTARPAACAGTFVRASPTSTGFTPCGSSPGPGRVAGIRRPATITAVGAPCPCRCGAFWGSARVTLRFPDRVGALRAAEAAIPAVAVDGRRSQSWRSCRAPSERAAKVIGAQRRNIGWSWGCSSVHRALSRRRCGCGWMPLPYLPPVQCIQETAQRRSKGAVLRGTPWVRPARPHTGPAQSRRCVSLFQ